MGSEDTESLLGGSALGKQGKQVTAGIQVWLELTDKYMGQWGRKAPADGTSLATFAGGLVERDL